MFYADSMTFFDLPGRDPFIANTVGLPNLAHVTCSPPWKKDARSITQSYEYFVRVLEEDPRVQIIEEKEDLVSLSREKIGILLGLQSPPPDHTDIFPLRSRGIRVSGIAYDMANQYGGGYKTNEPLTRRGELFINWCDSAGIIIDLSHAGYQTAQDALDVITVGSRKRVFASHSACFEIHPHPRNIRDDVMRRIAELGGVVGIPTITFFLHESDNSLNPFVQHILWAINITGEDTVCVGSDGTYKDTPFSNAESHYRALIKRLGIEDTLSRFPDHPEELIVYGSRRMDHLYYRLQKELGTRIAEKVIGLNFKDFLLRSL